MKDEVYYSLLKHNTFGIDVCCRRFLEYADEEEARVVASILREASVPYIIIGEGSNLLLTRDFPGIVVHSAMQGVRTEDNGSVVREYVQSGVTWDCYVAATTARGLWGAENLSLIPGDVGAAAVQNIGAYGVEVKDILESVEVLDIRTGCREDIPNAACDYAYRQSRFKKDWKNRYLVLAVVFRLSKDGRPMLDYGNLRDEMERRGWAHPTSQQVRDVIVDIRNGKLPDPKVLGNAGSFFMNPVVELGKYQELAALYPGMPHYQVDGQHVKIPAAWLIDQCGWKGKSVGKAAVHDRQALVLVNRGGASGAEIVALSDAIRKDVYERFGININPEVNII